VLSGNLDLAVGSSACTPCWPNRLRAPRNRSAVDAAAGWVVFAAVANLDTVENVRAKADADILLDVPMRRNMCESSPIKAKALLFSKETARKSKRHNE
jgi:hypothetical protein